MKSKAAQHRRRTAALAMRIVSLAAVIGSSWSPVLAVEDAYETDDTFAQASVIAIGSSQTHSIHIVGDHDYVRFSIPQATTIVLSVRSPIEYEFLDITLYDANRTPIADDSGDGFAAICKTLTAGEYFGMAAHGQDRFAIEQYTLSLTNIPRIDSGPTGSASSVLVNQPVSFFAGASHPSGLNLTYRWKFGDGTEVNSENPTHSFTAAGTYFVCLTVEDSNSGTAVGWTSVSVKDGGDGSPSVYGWGQNYSYQIGDGKGEMYAIPSPAQIQGVSEMVSFSAQYDTSYGLKEDGTVWGWGSNDYFLLGEESLIYYLSPVQVRGFESTKAISAGIQMLLALKDDGTVWAAGSNQAGQLGDGTTTWSEVAVQVVGLSNVRAICAGGGFCLALKDGGTVWAWGDNRLGLLGDGTTIDRHSPVQVPGLAGVESICAGEFHNLALKADGTVWSWGDNVFGQLGDGTTTDRLTPVEVSGISNVTAISCGCLHSIALKEDGTVWAWGDNHNGVIGDGSIVQRSTPVQVVGLTGVVSISSGDGHCVALKSDGTVWTWGYNGEGELGDGTFHSRSEPVQVLGLRGVASIHSGPMASHSFALSNRASDLVLSKTMIKVNYARADRDLAVVKGELELTSDFLAAGVEATLNVGGAQVVFILDEKGKARTTEGNLKLRFKKKAGLWLLNTKIKGNYAAQWVDEGVTNESVQDRQIRMPVSLSLGELSFSGSAQLIYKAKEGRKGVAK